MLFMPEDIPEELELPPDSPANLPQPPTMAAGLPVQESDWGSFWGIMGIVVGILVALLQMDNVPITWQISAVGYFLLTTGCVLTYLKHAVPNRGKFVRFSGAFVTVAIIGAIALFATRHEYIYQHAPSDQTNAKVLTAENDIKTSLNGLSDALGKSPYVSPAGQLAILYNMDTTLSNDESNLEEPHELLEDSPVDAKKLQDDGNRKYALRLLAERRQQYQRQMEDINNKEQAMEDQKAQQENEQEQQAEFLAEEKDFTRIVAPIFDFTIWELTKYLRGIGGQTAETPVYDFKARAPTIYASHMMDGDIFTNGTNYISIGTNSEWNYLISTTISPITANPHSHIRGHAFATLTISVQNTNGGASLVVEPLFHGKYDDKSMPQLFESRKIAGNIWIRGIGVTVTAPIIGNLNYSVKPNDYTNEIESAVQQLIEEQLQERPLPLKTN